MSIRPRNIPLLFALILLAHAGCGEATHVLVESQPVLITPSNTLPKNLVSRVDRITAVPDSGVTVLVDNVTVTMREDAEGRPVATLVATGALRANVPLDILLFEVVVEPSHTADAWIEQADSGVPSARHPTQLAAGEEGRWYWQTRATTNDLMSGGLVVRVRLVYEALV